MIVDKVSKDYCNARVTVPAGEDVYLSGKHHYVFGSNPFRFDGVEPAEQDKKKARKGKWITICSVIAGVIIGLFLPGGFLNPNVPDPQVFEKEDFQITLTEDFSEESLEDFLAVYISKSVYVFVMQEEKSYFDDITLEEYAQLVLEVNGRTDLLINKQEQYLWYEFTETPDAQELYYVSVCCEYEDAFYVVSFSTPVENRVDYKEQFLDWADTISFAADA